MTDRNSQAIPLPVLTHDIAQEEDAGLFTECGADEATGLYSVTLRYLYAGEWHLAYAFKRPPGKWPASRQVQAMIYGVLRTHALRNLHADLIHRNEMARLAAIGAVGAHMNGRPVCATA